MWAQQNLSSRLLCWGSRSREVVMEISRYQLYMHGETCIDTFTSAKKVCILQPEHKQKSWPLRACVYSNTPTLPLPPPVPLLSLPDSNLSSQIWRSGFMFALSVTLTSHSYHVTTSVFPNEWIKPCIYSLHKNWQPTHHHAMTCVSRFTILLYIAISHHTS